MSEEQAVGQPRLDDQVKVDDQSSAAKAWYESLPPELLEQHRGVFSKYQTPEALYKSHAEMQKIISKRKEQLSADEVRALFGVPPEPGGYELPVPEGGPEPEPEMLSEFRAKAHELALTPDQAKSLYEWYSGLSDHVMKKMDEVMQAETKQAEEELKKVWGRNYKKNLDKANTLLVQHVPEEMQEQLTEELIRTGLGRSPALVMALKSIADQFSEDALETGKSAEPVNYYEQALEVTRSQAYIDPGHPDHRQAVEKARRLFEKAFPEEK